MMTDPIEQLVFLLSKLPGLGGRSARRIVLYLLQDYKLRMKLLADALKAAGEAVVECEKCQNIDVISPCKICADVTRVQSGMVAVVETVADLWALERSKSYNGLYHILSKGGMPMKGAKTPASLKLYELHTRCIAEKIQEVIIATSATLDGQTTAFVISDFFHNTGIRVTRLASGIPVGGELDYLDDGTLAAAINMRATC